MKKKYVLICLFNFLIAALMGVLLRYVFIGDIGVNYRFLIHAHSHVAMLGWVYLMLYVYMVHYFVPEQKPIYNTLFWLTQFTVVGMMISFPLQGYAAFSITFSTLHIFCSYGFVFLIWKQHKTKTKVTSYLLKAALVFMVFSTFGVWCLGPAVAMLGKMSTFYQIAIQFFLHFQFNGWFLFGVLAVFFHILNVEYSKKFQLFFLLLITSTVLTMALPVYWFIPHFSLLWLNGLGVVVQFLALLVFLKIIKTYWKKGLKINAAFTIFMGVFAIICLVLKIILQLFSLVPEVASVIYQHRNFVIGFIHLLMLGVITGFLFIFILQSKFVAFNTWLYFALYMFVIGFVLTEITLLIQGCLFYYGMGFMPYYYELLFGVSVFLPFGILLIIINIYNYKKTWNINHKNDTKHCNH